MSSRMDGWRVRRGDVTRGWDARVGRAMARRYRAADNILDNSGGVYLMGLACMLLAAAAFSANRSTSALVKP